MTDEMELPSTIVAEFFRSPGEPIFMKELGEQYLEEMGYPLSRRENPLKIALEQDISNAGNIYYRYMQNAVPLPTGMDSLVKIEGVFIPLNRSGFSDKQYPFREGKGEIFVGKKIYVAKAYISKTRNPFYIKIVAHKKPDGSHLLKKPRGGEFL